MKQNKISPLEQLRQEKAILQNECKEGEDRLTGYWNYISSNVGSLFLSSAIGSVRRQLGFGGSSTKEGIASSSDKAKGSSSGLWQGVLGGVIAASPLIWELVQPMLMGFAMKKIKSIFSRKKKK